MQFVRIYNVNSHAKEQKTSYLYSYYARTSLKQGLEFLSFASWCWYSMPYQVSELHREAAVGIVFNVHHFSVVGQNKKLPAPEGVQTNNGNLPDSLSTRQHCDNAETTFSDFPSLGLVFKKHPFGDPKRSCSVAERRSSKKLLRFHLKALPCGQGCRWVLAFSG